MNNNSYFKLLLVLLVLMNSTLLFPGEVKIFDCDGSKLDPEISIIAKRWVKRIKKVMKKINESDCLPQSWRDDINRNFNNPNIDILIDLECDYEYCGQWDFKEQKFKFPKYTTITDLENCGCEEATILHEFLHAFVGIPDDDKWTVDPGKWHRKILACEIKCTSSIKKCIKYPPQGWNNKVDPCECRK